MFEKLCVLVKNSRRLYPHQKSYSTEFTTSGIVQEYADGDIADWEKYEKRSTTYYAVQVKSCVSACACACVCVCVCVCVCRLIEKEQTTWL